MAKKRAKKTGPHRSSTSAAASSNNEAGREQTNHLPSRLRIPGPAASLGALGSQVQERRQSKSMTQDQLARRVGASRTAVALLEQGRRMPGEQVLERIVDALELRESPLAHLALPEEQLRLRFEQVLSELVGRTMRLEHHDSEAVSVARERITSLFARDKTLEQAYDAFCTTLVFYGVPRPTRAFFDHYLGVDATASVAKLEAHVERFQKDAIRLFATFAEAYSAMALSHSLTEQLAPLQPRPDEDYRRREPWDCMEAIQTSRLPDLGYISAARVRQEQEERQSLSSFMLDLATAIENGKVQDALTAHPERKRRKMSSLLRGFGGALAHDFLSPLFAPDPDQLRREALRLAPKEENELARIAETQETGQRNLARYLASDHLDVYVATSMRSDADFASVNSFVESLFAHEEVRPFKLRYFNPTQSWIEDRVAKGLVEALMLRRADFTVYMAQKSDTFGKDSEASVALGQGKPVIVYVPRLLVPEIGLDSSEVGALKKEELLARVKNKVSADDIDDTADEQALISQLISAMLDGAPDDSLALAAHRHWADFDLLGEAVREEDDARRTAYRKWMDQVIAGAGAKRTVDPVVRSTLVSILTALATNFERRAHLFREVHPLALQVILSTGVLNGILVARSVDSCAQLLSNLLRNQLTFELVPDENNYRLVEKSTRSTVRVISRNQLIVNAFTSYYHALRAG